MAGLIGMVRSGEIPPGSRVLYAHLGGQPALSAYAHTPGLGEIDDLAAADRSAVCRPPGGASACRP